MNKTILFGAVVLSLLALFGYKSNAQIKEENNTVKNENTQNPDCLLFIQRQHQRSRRSNS